MRRSTIAVCLLLMSPVPALACFDHPPGVTAGWIEERPRSAWDLARGTAEETRWEELLGVASLAAGSGVMLLAAVALRAARRGRRDPREPAAPRPLGLPFDRPAGLPVRVDSGQERPGPTRILRAEANEPCPVAVAVTGRGIPSGPRSLPPLPRPGLIGVWDPRVSPRSASCPVSGTSGPSRQPGRRSSPEARS